MLKRTFVLFLKQYWECYLLIFSSSVQVLFLFKEKRFILGSIVGKLVKSELIDHLISHSKMFVKNVIKMFQFVFVSKPVPRLRSPVLPGLTIPEARVVVRMFFQKIIRETGFTDTSEPETRCFSRKTKEKKSRGTFSRS
jgi:hypothetical protein